MPVSVTWDNYTPYVFSVFNVPCRWLGYFTLWAAEVGLRKGLMDPLFPSIYTGLNLKPHPQEDARYKDKGV